MDEPEEMPPNPAQTALLNDVILWELSDYLSHPDLKSLRNVCRTWNYNMRNALFKSSYVVLNTMLRMTRFSQEMSNGDWNLPHIYLRIRPSTQEAEIKPSDFNNFFNKFSRRILELQFLMVLNASRNENLLDWFELLDDLEKIKVLWLDVDYYTLFPIDHIQVDSIPVLKSLKQLNIRMSCKLEGLDHSEGWEEENQMYEKWSQILIKMAPEISILAIDDITFLQYNCNENLQTELFGLMGNSKINDVRVVGFQESISLLLQIPNPLKNLTIIWGPKDLPPNAQDWEHLTELLSKHSKTLEDFMLSFHPEVEEPEDSDTDIFKIGLRFPEQMPELKGLHLQVILKTPIEELEDFRIDFQMQPVDYAKMFPKLEELSLDHGDLFRGVLNDVFLPRKMPQCHTLKVLSVKDPRRKLKDGFPEAIIKEPHEADFCL